MSDQELTILDDRARFLAGRGHDYTSQFGEDGLIQALFEQIGTTNRWCFEIGAADGLMYSNTRRLHLDGWRGLLIEGHPGQFHKLMQNAPEGVLCLNQYVQHDGLDGALRSGGAPKRPDFGVIDIDGQDYFLWREMTDHRPRVMLVEFSPYGTPDDMPAFRGEGQAGLNSIIQLGKEKGYVPLCHTYCNVLFVEQGEYNKLPQCT